MNKYSLQDLMRDMNELESTEVLSETDLRLWQNRASMVLVKIGNGLCDSNEIPEIIFHYLNDADVRFKDERYRYAQETELKKAMAGLRNALP
jgi:hypothetical protein